MTCDYPGGCQIPLTTRNGTPRKFKGGYCEVHDGRLRRTGQLGPPDSLQHRTCEHPDGCDRHQTHGSIYCSMHHSRVKRHGDLGPAGPYPNAKRDSVLPEGWTVIDGPCLHPDGCEIENPPRFIDGLCPVHWQRRHKTGSVGPPGYVNERQTGCAYPGGCEIDTDVFTKGYCQHHAMRLRNAGDLGPPGLVENQEHLRDLATSVYQCYDNTDRLLYVGIAAQLDRRLDQHRLYSDWWDDTSLVTAFDEPTRLDALRVERDTIKSMTPIHNVVHNA